jgi:hypothetical protein
MTAPKDIVARRHQALTELTAILERHDSEVAARLAKTTHGSGIPNPINRPLETAAYHAECMLSLARIVDEQLTPRKRGRPRKASS